MSQSDPIADFITVIRNGVRSRKTQVEVPFSKIKAEIARIQAVWAQTIQPAVYPVRPRRPANPRA